MAAAPRLRVISGRWQIPLLAASVAVLIAGLLRLRPAAPEVSFDDHVQAVRAAVQADRFKQASATLTALLDEDSLDQQQRATAHRLLAETIWLAESARAAHDPENARRILSNYGWSVQLGMPLEDKDGFRLAQASDWLGDSARAMDGYTEALKHDGTDRVAVLLRLVELLLAQPKRDWVRIDATIEQLIVAAADQPDALLRAVQWKIQRMLDNDDIDGAQKLLESVEAKLDVPPWSHHLQYFGSLILFRRDEFTAAEARLRALQANLRRSDPLYAQAGWLLGRINYMEGRPEEALAFYDEVIRAHAGSEYWLASLVGKAEALAALERNAASAQSYQRATEAMRRFQGSLVLDEAAIRTSLQTLAAVLSRASRPIEALPFAQIGLQMAEEAEAAVLPTFVELEARIHVQAAGMLLQQAGRDGQTGVPGSQPAAASQPASDDLLRQAREHYFQAGQRFLRLADLYVLNDPLADEASWQAAVSFDRAGRIEQAIEVLRRYVKEHPASQHTPEALHRLGQALQASGGIEEAIAAYEDLLAKFGRTPAAFASLVALARCYLAYGPKRYDTVENILLSIVEEDPARPALFTPMAPEFRAALVELATLYMRWDKPERAIERLEQALHLYPADTEMTRLQYQLADAYRRSGVALRDEAAQLNQPIQGDKLLREAHQRLARARDLFDAVATRLDPMSDRLGPTDQVHLQNSYVYRADCAFDTGQYAEAAELYGRVAWRWQNDPLALAAYVQVVRCYLATGELEAARGALARAGWVLRKIPDAQFNQPPDYRTRQYWAQVFAWMEQSGLLAANRRLAGTAGGG